MSSPHRVLNPDTLPPPSGFSHVVIPAPGRLVFLAGQTGHGADGSIDPGLVEQFERAAINVAAALDAAGGSPSDLTSIQIFVTDVSAYRAARGPIGAAYRRVLGTHYPAMSLFEVAALFDPAARVELVCTAVIPG
jgi:enamine deaminase RidA (YjgF/YER057c/UK114 family)